MGKPKPNPAITSDKPIGPKIKTKKEFVPQIKILTWQHWLQFQKDTTGDDCDISYDSVTYEDFINCILHELCEEGHNIGNIERINTLMRHDNDIYGTKVFPLEWETIIHFKALQ